MSDDLHHESFGKRYKSSQPLILVLDTTIKSKPVYRLRSPGKNCPTVDQFNKGNKGQGLNKDSEAVLIFPIGSVIEDVKGYTFRTGISSWPEIRGTLIVDEEEKYAEVELGDIYKWTSHETPKEAFSNRELDKSLVQEIE